MRLLLRFALSAAAACAACDAPSARKAAAATDASAVAQPADNGLIPGTPAGDLGDWVHDIRAGISGLGRMLPARAGEAQRAALDLYVTRQEYSEMYYGVDGRLKGNAELATAIETAETRFHELLQLLAGSSPTVDTVQTAIDALDKQQAVVADLWLASSQRLQRPAAR